MGVALPFPLVADASLACCKVGLDRPLIPAAFAANLFGSATVSRPRRAADRGSFVRRGSPHPSVRLTEGLRVTHKRLGTGRRRSQRTGKSGYRARTSLEAPD